MQPTCSSNFVNAGTIWTFWDGNPPDLVLRCIESMRRKNPKRPVVVVSKSSLPIFLDPNDYPTFSGRPGTPDDFSSPQYLSDWVRLTLLEKYGGIWFDASLICTSRVESWISQNEDDITMFPMHANSNIHGNWTMASPKPGHSLIRAWRAEMARVLNEAGPQNVPTGFCRQAFIDFPAVVQLWIKPNSPPLPYLWVYLVLQVVLHKHPELHTKINLKPSIDGPMYRRYFFNIEKGISDNIILSDYVTHDLATKPLALDSHDRYFIKLVGEDRPPCQRRLQRHDFTPNSALAFLHGHRPRSIAYGCNLQDIQTQEALIKFRAAVFAVMVSNHYKTETRQRQRRRPSYAKKLKRSASQKITVAAL